MPMSLGTFASSAFLFVAVGILLNRAWDTNRMSVSDSIPQWIAFGDSITQFAWGEGGYGAALQHTYQRKLDVIQRGYSGYNTRWALLLLPQILPTAAQGKQIKVLSIFFGANDAVYDDQVQNVPLDEYKENLKKMVALVHSESSAHFSPSTEVIIIGIPPVALGSPTRERGRTATYAQASLDVVNELRQAGDAKVWHVETHNAMLARAKELNPEDPESGLQQLEPDGLHLSAAGYAVVTEQIWKTIDANLPGLQPDALLRFAPDWGSIDRDQPWQQLKDLRHHGFQEGVAFGKG